tara:strand:- start:25450 stop:26346 length:897 start_codon:yes stop_codon:yes gene_type:complete
MENKPFFSIVIPTYNSSEFLERALLSVINQSFQNFEIIVIDNSSVDNTNNVLKKFKMNNINIIKVNNDGIIAYSRNKGIENAKGEWIAFLDSDDVWQPQKLEKVNDTINHNSKVIMICHDEVQIHNGEIKNKIQYRPSGSNIYERLLFQGNFISTSAVCLRKDIAKKSGGFSEQKIFVTVEDYEYWIRLSQLGDFFFINEILGEWHTHDNNYSSNAKIHSNALIEVIKYHLGIWKSNFPDNNRKLNRGLSNVFFISSRILQKGSLFSDAKKHAIKSICLNPFQLKAWVILLLSSFRIN